MLGLAAGAVIAAAAPASQQGEQVEEWWDDIVEICEQKWGLDPYLVAAIVKKESWFNASAVNEAERLAYESGHPAWFGEYYGKGLMQLTGPWNAGVPFPNQNEWEYNMVPEARWEEAPRMDDPFNGRQNLDRGCWLLKALFEHYDLDVWKATTAYNYGWQGTDAGLVDPYTFSYAQQVMDYRRQYIESAGGLVENGESGGTEKEEISWIYAPILIAIALLIVAIAVYCRCRKI